MSWIDTIWSLNASTCLMLGFVYGLIWLQRREKVETGIFAILAVSTFGYSIIELWTLRTSDPVQFGSLLQWAQIPFFFSLIALVALVRVHLLAGRRWLAWVIVGGRALTLILNFVFSPSVHFREITEMQQRTMLGEVVYVPVGLPNPWLALAHISLFLLVIFIADATVTIWRRGDPLRERLLSFAILVFVFFIFGLAIEFFWQDSNIPLVPSIFFLGIVLVMGFELSLEILRAAELAGDLKRSKEELVEAQRLAKLGSWTWDVETDAVTWSEEIYRQRHLDPDAPIPILSEQGEFQAPESWERFKAALADCVRTGQPQELETELVRPDGQNVWALTRCEAIRDASGRIVKLRGTTQDITERRLAERQLQSSEERFAKAFDASPAPISIYGQRDHTLIEVNEQWAKVFGYSRDEVIGEEAINIGLIEPEVREQIAKLIGEQGSLRNLNVEIKTKSGEIRQISLSAEQIVIDGEPCNIFFHHDITDQKRVEEEKQKLIYDLGERVKELTGLHQTARILQDESKSVVEILQAIVELLPPAWQYPSITAGRIQYGEIDVKTPNFAPTQWSQTAEFTAAGSKGIIEVVYLEERPAMDIGAFLTEEENLINSLAEMVRAALHRRYAEIELRKSEERYRDLVENALDIIYTHDLKGNYTSINKAGERITGYQKEEVLTMNLTDTVALDFLDRARQMMVNKLGGENETVYDLEIIAKDGHPIAVEVNTRLILHEGVPVGIQGIARDVTERRQLEERLRQSQKLEGIGQLAGGIAHDFNNLLTAINGYADLSLRKIATTNDAARQCIEQVRKAGDRAAALTGQLLAFSRRQVLSPRVHNVNTVIQDVEKMLERLIKKDVELSAVYEPHLWNIKADSGQIEQVIVNLAVNARDAMPDGGRLTIKTQNIHIDDGFSDPDLPSTPGDYVNITVSDTGTGMDDEVKQHIFEPFYTTKETGKGTGLGLAMVYGIITQSGGSLKVYSEVGHGTTFKIYLPRVDEAEQKAVHSVESAEGLSGTETILLVEDDAAVRSLAREILMEMGYKVLDADNGRSALAVCDETSESIDLLVTDVIMPWMTGPVLKGEILKRLPTIKVILMSGYTDDTLATSYILDDKSSFLDKPFTPLQLARKVRDVLDS